MSPRRSSRPPSRPSSAARRLPPILAAPALLSSRLHSFVDSSPLVPRPPFGFQSGFLSEGLTDGDLLVGGGDVDASEELSEAELFDDDSFASSFTFDPERGVAYVTGGTYGVYFDGTGVGERDGEGDDAPEDVHLGDFSDCFVAAIEAPPFGGDGGGEAKRRRPRVLRSLRMGTASSPDACSSLVAPPFGSSSDPSAAAAETVERLAVLGHTEEGGYLTGLREVGSKKATVYGLAMDVELDLRSGGSAGDGKDEGGEVEEGEGDRDASRVVGGRLLHGSKAQYPVAAAAAAPGSSGGADGNGDDDVVYVAMVDTDDVVGGEGAAAEEAIRDRSYSRPYGRAFRATVLKLGRKSESEVESDSAQSTNPRAGGAEYPYRETMKVLWERPLAARTDGTERTDEADGVDVADLLYVPRGGGGGDPPAASSGEEGAAAEERDFLLLAGSTRGYGSAFGADDVLGSVGSGGGDVDGFVTKLRADTGEEDAGGGLGSPPPPHSLRITSQDGRDDVVRGACIRPVGGGGDGGTGGGGGRVRYSYVVGTTEGVMDPDSASTTTTTTWRKRTFVVKIDLDAMEIMWRRQFGSPEGGYGEGGSGSGGGGGGGHVAATSCAVTPDGRTVYVGGTATSGASLEAYGTTTRTTSAGGDDVFLMKLDADDGEAAWTRQIGTPHDDWLARGNGVAVDGDGGAVLYGSTRGGLMRARGGGGGDGDGKKSPPADVFVMSVSREGDFLAPVEKGEPQPSSSSSPEVDPSPPDDGGEGEGPAGFGKVGLSAQNGSTASGGRSGRVTFLVAACMAVLFSSLFCFAASRARPHGGGRGAYTNKSREEVERYLEDFEDTEIDVRASATGGWHGMYSFDAERSRLKKAHGRSGSGSGSGSGSEGEITVELSQMTPSSDGGSVLSGSSSGGGGRRGF